MAQKPKRIRYQCAWTGKLYDSEAEAEANCPGPYQAFEQGYDRYPKKGIFGTVAYFKEKKVKRR